MIKEALQYLVELGEPTRINIHGDEYCDRKLYRVDEYIPMAEALKMSTLSSLVDYIRSEIDGMANHMIIHIVSPSEVNLISMLNYDRKRESIVRVKADIPDFRFNTFIDKEMFVIGIQSKFINDKSTDKDIILKFAGTVENGTVSEYGDDGVTQKATVKTGIASKSEAIVPNPVRLRPFRTFVEVPQPASEFVFRMKQEDRGYGVSCALFEADGGIWQLEAKDNIKRYLKQELDGYKDKFIVIS